MMPRTVKGRFESVSDHVQRGEILTNLNADQSNDDLLKTLCVPARDGFLEELKHILKDLS